MRRAASLTWLSFITGMTVMASELAASRLVAPSFGSGTSSGERLP
ncbi:hypothetical protein [Corallococcus macrosporus]|uniref:Spermidine synthase n=1 Tax=Corallococcus macrosporus DSM 14697 TaxID=1189310 RepID=A0A250K338_9BACT|nr:hypothetical protein [Corallococcus macrosporus]ATB50423.1 spermidine synthase [Corallococcus macrosporus DSM 14697]